MKNTDCAHCGKPLTGTAKYCGLPCFRTDRSTKVCVACTQCGAPLIRKAKEVRKNQSGTFFCNCSCKAVWSHQHKTKGIRVSRFELYCQERLPKIFPELKFVFNDKTTILSELDIFLPQLRLAIEINGIFHYEPIYGQDKFERIQQNDKQKMMRCNEKGIELMVVNMATVNYSGEKYADKHFGPYLSAISDLITSLYKRKER